MQPQSITVDAAANDDDRGGLPIVAAIAALEQRGVAEIEQWLAVTA